MGNANVSLANSKRKPEERRDDPVEMICSDDINNNINININNNDGTNDATAILHQKNQKKHTVQYQEKKQLLIWQDICTSGV